MSSFRKEFLLDGSESQDEFVAGDDLADSLEGNWVLVRKAPTGKQWLCVEEDDDC